MSFWSTPRLKEECQAQGLITPYQESRALRCAYELGIGSEAFITSEPSHTTHLSKGSKVVIPSGQFGLLTTQEVVYVPDNAIAFISMRARVKFRGLVNVSGFHVDPGYRGKLKFAVYNAGSQSIVLDQGEPVFMIWYADLDGPTSDPYPLRPALDSVITAEDVSRIQGQVASPAELKKQIDELRAELKEKFHASEQSRLYNRGLMGVVLSVIGAIVVAIVVWAVIKPAFDGSAKTNSADPAKTSIVAPVIPAEPSSGGENVSAPAKKPSTPTSANDNRPMDSGKVVIPKESNEDKADTSPTPDQKWIRKSRQNK